MYENINVFESHFFYRDLGEKYWSKRVNSRNLSKTVDTVLDIVRNWVYSSDMTRRVTESDAAAGNAKETGHGSF